MQPSSGVQMKELIDSVEPFHQLAFKSFRGRASAEAGTRQAGLDVIEECGKQLIQELALSGYATGLKINAQVCFEVGVRDRADQPCLPQRPHVVWHPPHVSARLLEGCRLICGVHMGALGLFFIIIHQLCNSATDPRVRMSVDLRQYVEALVHLLSIEEGESWDQGRLKSLHSIHSKMARKGVPLEEIYDARALRIVIDDGGERNSSEAVTACYQVPCRMTTCRLTPCYLSLC